MVKKTIVIATRMSQLALWQANWVGRSLCAKHHGLKYELLPIITSADKHEKPLQNLGGKGLFVKAVQDAVLENKADLAVHSAKDLPCVTVDGLVLAAVPTRSFVEDMLVAKDKLQALPYGSIIATGSPRRATQLKFLRNDLIIKPIRGNVPTRLEKYKNGECHGLVLAKAGLDRLGLIEHAVEVFSPENIVPAAGQGSLAIECRDGDLQIQNLLTVINDQSSYAMLIAERACLQELGGHCFAPIGAYARLNEGGLIMQAVVVGGDAFLRAELSANMSQPEHLGRAIAKSLNEQGAQNIIKG